MVKRQSGLKFTRVFILFLFVALFSPRPVQSAELKQQTVHAFDHYIARSEHRMQSELRNGPFLYIDSYPAARRSKAYSRLRAGQILLRDGNAEEKNPIKVPDGLIHDWTGVLFIPGASLPQALGVILDYNDYHNIYSNVLKSRLISHNGNTSKIFLQLYKKSLVTVVFNAKFESKLERLGTNRAVVPARTTRIAEVEDAGQSDAHELAPDAGHGYMWRLNSYWRFEQKDGGVYVQVESIALSRSVPAIIAWLVNPLLESIPRNTLSTLLSETRTAVQNAAKEKTSTSTQSRLRGGKLHSKSAAAAKLAFNRNASAVPLDNLRSQRKPQPCASGGA